MWVSSGYWLYEGMNLICKCDVMTIFFLISSLEIHTKIFITRYFLQNIMGGGCWGR